MFKKILVSIFILQNVFAYSTETDFCRIWKALTFSEKVNIVSTYIYTTNLIYNMALLNDERFGNNNQQKAVEPYRRMVKYFFDTRNRNIEGMIKDLDIFYSNSNNTSHDFASAIFMVLLEEYNKRSN